MRNRLRSVVSIAVFRRASPDSVKKLAWIILVTAICASNLFAQKKEKPEKICITPPEAEVYEVIGVGNYHSQTSSFPFVEQARLGFFPKISPEVVTDFNQKNARAYRLRCVLRNDGRKKNLTSYEPTTGTQEFSRIGFNKAETEALVYMGWSGIGNTCESDYFFLRKENGKWLVVKKVMMVIC